MTFYVQLKNGKVQSQPQQISSDPSDSPNTQWGLDQMIKNGFLPCILNYDPMKESPDYSNPIVGQESVTYPTLPLSDAQKIDLVNASIDKHRSSEYPTHQQMIDALWLFATNNDRSNLDQLQKQIDNVNAKYPKAS